MWHSWALKKHSRRPWSEKESQMNKEGIKWKIKSFPAKGKKEIKITPQDVKKLRFLCCIGGRHE